MKQIMMKIAFFAMAVMLLAGCKQNGYKISGQVEPEWADGKVYCQIGGNQAVVDSAIVAEDGTFQMGGTQENSQISTLYLVKGTASTTLGNLILEAGKIKVIAQNNEFRLSGTPNNDLLQKLVLAKKSFEDQLNALYKQWTIAEDVQQRKAIELNFDSIDTEMNKMLAQFARKNNDNIVGALALIQASKMLSESEQEAILSIAKGEFLAQQQVQKIAQRLAKLKRVAEGATFVDFTMKDPNGNAVSLSDYAGKGTYLVVDFWASWCSPCRRAMPELKQIYQEFQPRGVDFLGVSLDKDKESWLSAIATLELPWAQMSDLKGWQSVGSDIYGVNAIPHLMLLDPNGVILARNLNDEQLLSHLQAIFK